MRKSFLSRVARASVAGTLLLSLSHAPALARMAAFRSAGPAAHSGFFHAHPFGFRGFDRVDVNRFGFDRFAFRRFGFRRLGFNRFGFNRFGTGPSGFNPVGLTGWGWGWGGWGWETAAVVPAQPIIAGDSGPVVINVPVGAGEGGGYTGAGGNPEACVVHLLKFDSAGKYVGEQQTPEC